MRNPTRKRLPLLGPAHGHGRDRSAWASLADEQLLDVRLRDLGVRIEGTRLEEWVDQLHRELDRKGVAFSPPCYLADEWECPDGVPAIGIPFFLAHARLRRLEKKMMLEVEGAKKKDFMRLLRHECGHAINYAYELHKRPRWRKLFGPFSADYKDTYPVHPHTRKYVRHLSNFYAQKHPDEDFAETFAVWLDPRSAWRRRYAGWGASVKLQYIDHLMREEMKGADPAVIASEKDYYWRVDKIRCSLRTYYRKRRENYQWAYSTFYDSDLKKLFGGKSESDGMTAERFLRERRSELVRCIRKWSYESSSNLTRLIDDLIARCGQLGLRLGRPEETAALEVDAYITALAVNYRRMGKFREGA